MENIGLLCILMVLTTVPSVTFAGNSRREYCFITFIFRKSKKKTLSKIITDIKVIRLIILN